MKKTVSLFQLISLDEKKSVHKKTMPAFIKPMLAQLTHSYFSDKDWIFERKLDGERCFLFNKGNSVILKSRNDKLLNNSYPEIVNAIKNLSLPPCILDGEIVALKKGMTSFSLLQKRFGITGPIKAMESKIPVYYYVFDILYYDGYLVTHLPLLTRKRILKNGIAFKGIFRYLTHRNQKGLVYFKQACKDKWEGLIAKQKNSLYVSKRSPNWLKFKCSNEQEFVIGGYTESTNPLWSFGALLIGYYDNHTLKYAGKVGTGFDQDLLKELGKELKKIEIKTDPFTNYDLSTKQVHWVKPILVCEIRFSEWTTSSKLRHPSFLGLRRDKSAKEVRKE